MKKNSLILGWILLVVLVVLATGCSTQVGGAAVTPTLALAPTPATYTDPFAYCAVVGTIDKPDARYTGDPVPEVVINGFKKAAGLQNSPEPMDIFKKATIWRCMENKVYVCNFGANLPCEPKANTSKTPTAGMADFCKANPNADFLPMAVTGHDTIYSWHCVNDTPEVLNQISQVDAAGYIKNIWYPIEPNP